MAGVRSGYSHCNPDSTACVCTYVGSLHRQLLNRRRASRSSHSLSFTFSRRVRISCHLFDDETRTTLSHWQAPRVGIEHARPDFTRSPQDLSSDSV
jgi:hypothetical protein